MVCLKDQANWKLDGARRLAPNIDVPPIRSMFGFSRAPNPHRPLRAGPPLAPFRTRLARQSHILLPWFFVALVGTSASFAESNHAQTKARLGRQSRALQGMIDELREERLNGWTGLGIQIGNGKGEEGKPRLTEEEIERRLMVVGLRERPKVDSEEALKLGEENEFAWEEEGIKRGFWDRLLKGKSQGEKKVRPRPFSLHLFLRGVQTSKGWSRLDIRTFTTSFARRKSWNLKLRSTNVRPSFPESLSSPAAELIQKT
jgi:hypothetical protein